MKFMLACLVAATLLVVAAPYNLLAIGAAVVLIAMGLLEFGCYAVREARKAQHRNQIRMLEEAQEEADYAYWQEQGEAAFAHHLVYDRGEGLILDHTADEKGYS